jgi:hypothetical protein
MSATRQAKLGLWAVASSTTSRHRFRVRTTQIGDKFLLVGHLTPLQITALEQVFVRAYVLWRCVVVDGQVTCDVATDSNVTLTGADATSMILVAHPILGPHFVRLWKRRPQGLAAQEPAFLTLRRSRPLHREYRLLTWEDGLQLARSPVTCPCC